MDKRLSKKEYQKVVKAAQAIPGIALRGDLETRRSDREDFVEVAVWSLEEALIEAFLAGKNEDRKSVV